MLVGNVEKVVTHAGNAHADDLLAVAVLLTKYNVPVHRVRKVTQEDLDNPRVVVVDIGGEYNPDRNNYDHHQDRNLPCSLVLVLQEFGYTRGELLEVDEIRFVSEWDARGAIAVQKEWGLKLPPFRELISELVIRIFSEQEVIYPETVMHEMLKQLGAYLLKYIKETREFIEAARNAKVEEIKGVKVVKLDKNVPIRFVKKVHPDVGVVVQPNLRTEGAMSLTRVDDHPKVNFKKVQEFATFVHPTGFMAVVAEEKVDEVLPMAIEE